MSAPDQAAPILELADVSKVYRARTSLMRYALVPAVQDVSLAILPRTTTCIMGETGSGKSTIGRLLLGLTEPTSGEVRFRGRSVATLAVLFSNVMSIPFVGSFRPGRLQAALQVRAVVPVVLLGPRGRHRGHRGIPGDQIRGDRALT